MSPADDVHKYFSDIMNRIKENRVESGNDSSHEDIKPLGKDSPTFSKKIVNYYVEEDDANSVVTCEEDDCISPGYHLSLPMEIHGSCYSKMQIVSKASLSRLKGVPRAIVTQNSFDIETFSIHIANKLCSKNNKKYGILFDLAFEIVHVRLRLFTNRELLLTFHLIVGLSTLGKCSKRAGLAVHRERHRKAFKVLQLLARLRLLRAPQAFRVDGAVYVEDSWQRLDSAGLRTAQAAVGPHETESPHPREASREAH